MSTFGTIEQAWTEIEEHDNWDDYHEYEVTDYMNRYNVIEDDAVILWMVVQSRTDYRRAFYSIKEQDEGIIPEIIREAQHQSFDGWTTPQRLVIEAFLSDIAWGIHNMGLNKKPKSPRRIEHPEDMHENQARPYWNTPDVDAQVDYDEGADITDGATDEEK